MQPDLCIKIPHLYLKKNTNLPLKPLKKGKELLQ